MINWMYGRKGGVRVVKMIAHRGASLLAPENTLPAYELAGKLGYFGGECDIHETLDHQFVLMHDETLNRMTNGTGKIGDYTLEELKHCKIINGAFYEKFPNLKIPTLEEYLTVCKKNGLTPVIEIKKISKPGLPRFLETIYKYFKSHEVIIISFNEKSLIEVRRLDSKINIQWLAWLTEENIHFCANYNMDIDTSHKHVTKKLVAQAHSKNVLVNAWTVNEEELLKKLTDMGIDFITTDHLGHS